MNRAPEPGLYRGWLRHRRFHPVAHEFTYPLFMALLDVDRLAESMQQSWLTSYNRFNVASFDQRDHFGQATTPLRERLAADAARHQCRLPNGRVLLLTQLRHFGYCFNPISLYYCYDQENQLQLVLAEVSNTNGGAQNYWLQPPAAPGVRRHFTASAGKQLDVSPFMIRALRYDFDLTPPCEQLVAHITATPLTIDVSERIGTSRDPSSPQPRTGATSRLFDATLSLSRRPWTPREIRRALLRYPVMTAQVIAAIHFEALRLWWKGVPVVARVPVAAPTQATAAGTDPVRERTC